MVLVAGLAGAVGGLMLERTGVGDWLMAPAAPRVTVEQAARHFALCSGASRNTCVVDGDTFWLDGIKIRIADINTPEIGAPQCAAEAALGRRAMERLRELLNEGTFSLVGIDRDEDQYGRKLRIVERNGRSVGAVLVAEGLAHEWRGRRESWC
ncbi:thermonuclease family protein [Devosia sp. 63-57]|uniref:thermonuclease family protein n=1 Tax=Devosia sp. 63-57 TaxID=1895751 RepID=UPI000AA3998E|nr:thermonuclease family protein [Devosia sp. 63-57]